MATVDDVIKLMEESGSKWLDIRCTDVPGTWHHVSFPKSEVTEGLFSGGTGFDGSSLRGFQTINESDMLLFPDADTATVDPIIPSTVSVIADVRDPITLENYDRDPRHVAAKAEAYLKSTGYGDESLWGPEAEFFIFDSVSYGGSSNSAHYVVDSEEAIWNTGNATDLMGDGPNLGHKVRYKGGYFPVPPTDTQTEIRAEACEHMAAFGIEIEKHHHEVATAGQGEINWHASPLKSAADKVMAYKYCLKNTARKYGKTATFMPKPLFEDNGTGMHTHQSIWKHGKPQFAGDGYVGLSEMALAYTGGLLKHGAALMALVAPSSNSYKRLVPGFEAPTILALSARNRSAAARIPMYSNSPNSKRIEFRPPDPTCNPYLAFSAMLMAGLDGIDTGADPGEPMQEDLYEVDPALLTQVPGSLSEALDALEADHDFLLKGGVFTPDLLEAYIAFKREHEVDAVRLRPHPHEFFLSYDA